jgi:PHP family Zn ribbon phosphoesterase
LTVRADLHVHTVLSPCAEIEMIPPLIVRRALDLGLGLIAVTDHNTAENVAAVKQAAAAEALGQDGDAPSLTVLPGIEVQTREEVHLLCLFDELEQVERWQAVVGDHLPALKNHEEAFGAQYVVDATGAHVRTDERLLLNSCDLTVEQVVWEVDELGGLTIAAHVDRPSYSLLANLGFIPDSLGPGSGGLVALELSRRTSVDRFRAAHRELADWPLIASGDAHRLGEMQATTQLTVREASIAELRLALSCESGRCHQVVGTST